VDVRGADQPQPRQTAGVVSGTDDHFGSGPEAETLDQVRADRTDQLVPGDQPRQPDLKIRRNGLKGCMAPDPFPHLGEVGPETVAAIYGRKPSDQD
jgi:hypothetical protein